MESCRSERWDRLVATPLLPAVDLDDAQNKYTCETCPYVYFIERKVRRRGTLRTAAAASGGGGGGGLETAFKIAKSPYAHPCAPCRPLQITKTVQLKRKELEPVLGGDEEWQRAAKTESERPVGRQAAGQWGGGQAVRSSLQWRCLCAPRRCCLCPPPCPAPACAVRCAACGNNEAYFQEIQVSSGCLWVCVCVGGGGVLVLAGVRVE